MSSLELYEAFQALSLLPYLSVDQLVLLVSDEPSALTGQPLHDLRSLANLVKIPLLDASSLEEAQAMVDAAFPLSANLESPVIIRLAPGISQAIMSANQHYPINNILPSKSELLQSNLVRQVDITQRFERASSASSESHFNSVVRTGLSPAPAHLGIIAGGISWSYLEDAIARLGYLGTISLMKIGMPVAFPDKLATEFLKDLDEAIVFESQEPYIEQKLIEIVGRNRLKTKIIGFLNNAALSENTASELMAKQIFDFISA
ncbi:MAG: hypothetical protein FWD45_00665 [Coriobacteriia bacterium]|nr:hypothetical protein [Coriobacteriia bacterium]